MIGRRAAAATLAAAGLAAAGLAACGNPNQAELERNRQFDCRDRTASYLATGSLVAAELGVMIDCRDHGPRIVRWTTTREGDRVEHAASLGVGEFDRLWEKIEGAGWRYLTDCDGTGQPSDPIYTFDVVDWNGQASFACTHAGELPFPYFIIVEQLDMTAAAHAPKDHSTQRGPDDP